MSIAFISLGSNVGDRNKNIESALNQIKEAGIEILKCSTVIETDPVGGPSQNKFLNSVIKIQTDLKPIQLLNKLQKIEKFLGRIRTVKNGPRTIDLDILLFDDLSVNNVSLTIPHPRMFERDFVMRPLKEIEPNIINLISNFNLKN